MNPRQPHTTRSEARSALLLSLLRSPSGEVYPAFIPSGFLNFVAGRAVRCGAARYIQPPGGSSNCSCRRIIGFYSDCDCNDCQGKCSHRKSAVLENLDPLEANSACEGEWSAKGEYPFWKE